MSQILMADLLVRTTAGCTKIKPSLTRQVILLINYLMNSMYEKLLREGLLPCSNFSIVILWWCFQDVCGNSMARVVSKTEDVRVYEGMLDEGELE